MRRRMILYSLVVVVFLFGQLLGMVLQAAYIDAQAQAPNAVKVLWQQPCAGDRVIVTKAMLVRCLKDVPPPLPTPTPAPTQGMP